MEEACKDKSDVVILGTGEHVHNSIWGSTDTYKRREYLHDFILNNYQII